MHGLQYLLFLILTNVYYSCACFSSGGEYDDDFMTTPAYDSEYKDQWIPPAPHKREDYENWMKEYEKKRKEKEAAYYAAAGGKGGAGGNGTDGVNVVGSGSPMRPKDAGKDWPSHWKGLGLPYTGEEPPPWAILPNASPDIPYFCFMPPVRGNCSSYSTRYGYNPYTNICESFFYSGCNGNLNNFLTKERCDNACKNSVKTPCINKQLHDLHNYTDPDWDELNKSIN